VIRWALLVLVSGCAEQYRQPDPVPVPPGGCLEVGRRLKQLDCRYADGAPIWLTPKGTPLAEACETAAADGRPWHVECLLRLRSCDEYEARYYGELCE